MKNRFNINNKIERVEAYDNSFFGNNYAVASYVVFNEEGFSIKESRTYKFKDYDLKKFGDADLMRKVFQSRFSKDDKILPDLIIIDGGQPYLKICQERKIIVANTPDYGIDEVSDTEFSSSLLD